MTYEEILEPLSNYNPDALLLEPRRVYGPCLFLVHAQKVSTFNM